MYSASVKGKTHFWKVCALVHAGVILALLVMAGATGVSVRFGLAKSRSASKVTAAEMTSYSMEVLMISGSG